ncbi:hypothetical protein A1O1_07756 [Capronia coronata CBS 617.96]|uniref:Acyltransferase 3 domain-containing protein n=1 Tax=Capronia coronata CBS 617.96 TaxID=1182541 RepID=W9XXI0_9EURO|nr:uncharacterized protein A1O1_07756 [Capronia coronata CBS 617.96]EXJ81691.1 hypothetical protein A1O1_07756 [Capronia coronata CBS 617.96]
MASYIPLVSEGGPSSPVEHDPEHIPYADIDLEKRPDEDLPRWYQRLPRWKTASRWDMSSAFYRSRPKWEDIPDAKTFFWLFLSYIIAALPRFLQPGGLKIKKELHPTAYLDALRGWAALSVFRYHCFANKTWLLEQPVIRMVLNGRAMVDIFFVISGYVLSYRLLKMMRNQQPAMLRALASSTFRRWFRLYASCGVASFVTAYMTYLGWCLPGHRKPTIWLQLHDWMWDFIGSSNPLGDIKGWWYPGVFRTHYLDQMWTIPVEFRGSMLLFWFCAAAAFLSMRGRRTFAMVVIGLCYWWGIVYGALFIFGMLIADVSFDRHPERLQRIKLPQQQQEGDGLEPKPRRQSIPAKIGWVLLTIVACFILGQPPDGHWEYAWAWPTLSHAVPYWYPIELGEHFWLSIGSTLLVFCLDNCRMLQIPFELSFSQYLGDLSFGIYAMHNTILWVLYMPIVQPWCYRHFGDGYWSGLPGMLFTAIVVLWAADYFTRIDSWVVWFAKWLEDKTFIKWE